MTTPTMTTDEALAALDLLISYSGKQARHTNADAALDVVRQALQDKDTTIANQALAYADLSAAVDALEATVKAKDALLRRLIYVDVG